MIEWNARIDERLRELRDVKWFSAVGAPVANSPSIRLVSSWDEAFTWCADSVSWWCNVEGKKVLYETLATTHYSRFIQWNNIATATLPKVIELVQSVILPSRPTLVFPEQAQGWIQSQILSGLMELAYRDCFEVKLFTYQLGLYSVGHFPCGWDVRSPDDFPTNAQIVVY